MISECGLKQQTCHSDVICAAKADQRPHAYPLFGERGQGAAVPEGAAGSPGEHGLP